jgi:prefoldin subunit 5
LSTVIAKQMQISHLLALLYVFYLLSQKLAQEEVDKFVGQGDPLVIHAALRELLRYVRRIDYLISSSKYNFMFESMLAQKRAVLRKVPDIQQAIEVVDFLNRRQAEGVVTRTHFPLTDNCYAKAEIPPTEKVCLWLGANVMLEYSIDEAEALLKNSNNNATETLKKLDDNLAFLRDQITTTEVNIARIHNHMVKIKAQLRALESGGEPVQVSSE